MSYASGLLRNFAGFISATIAAGALATAFKLTSPDAPPPPEQSKCVAKYDAGSGLEIYQPECK